MRLSVLLIGWFVAVVSAETENVERKIRAPQGQLKYNDPSGLKVNWKFFVPQRPQPAEVTGQELHGVAAQHQPQYQSHSQYQVQNQPQHRHPQPQAQRQPHPQRQPHSQHQPSQPQAHYQPQPQQLVQPAEQVYKPYSAVPGHIKQLILSTYDPQRPYVDPSAFLYQGGFPQQSVQPVHAESTGHYEQPSPQGKYQVAEESQHAYARSGYAHPRASHGRIEYAEEHEQQQQPQEHRHHYAQPAETPTITVPVESLPTQPIPKLLLDKGMPSEIQQLLQYQAQIPYDVIANRILYKPKSLFIPKPLPEDAKGAYNYRSKIYYLKNDDVEPEYPEARAIEEDQHQ